MSKQLDYVASIIKGTNRAIGESENDWVTVRPGSYLKFENDHGHYVVASSNEFFYIKDFTCDDLVRIRLEENVGGNLTRSDVVKITYKEYELKLLINIINKGSGFCLEDNVLLPGELSVDINDNLTDPCHLVVTEINEEGGVEKLEVVSKGKYLTQPDSEILTVSDAKGVNLKIKAEYQEKPQRATIEKTIKSVERQDGHSYATLLYPLPKGVAKGKVSIRKWELFLSSSYAGETKFDEICHITRDFTPNLKLPLMSEGGGNKEMAFNEAISFLDAKVGYLEKRIKLLEGKAE